MNELRLYEETKLYLRMIESHLFIKFMNGKVYHQVSN